MRASEYAGSAAAQRGFTYIWLLLLIALMGVGMTVAADVQTTGSQRDKEKELLAIGRQFRAALASYDSARLPTSAAGPPAGMWPGQQVSSLPPAAGGSNVPAASGGGQQMLPPQNDPRAYPASLDELLKDERFPGIRRHLRKIFVDPMTGKAEWGLVQISGRIVGIHSLSTAVPIKQAGFEGDEQAFVGAQSYVEWVFGVVNPMSLPNAGKANGATSETSLPFFLTSPLPTSSQP